MAEDQANILLVDDQPANLLALEAVLEELGHRLVRTGSGEEALRRLLDQDFAVILLDVRMHGLDGFETAKLVRGRERSRHTPILFLTSHEDNRLPVEEAYALGAVDYLVKPVVPVILRAKVAVFVELFRKTEQVKGQAERLRRLERREFERRLAEEDARLRRSEERFARFMQHLPGLAWIKDGQGRYVFANDAALRAFGTRREELYGRTDEEVFPAETAAQFRENDLRALAGGSGVQTIETLEHEDGVLHHSLVSKFAIPGPDGGAALVGGMAIDVTEQKRTRAVLEESEQRFRQLAENVNAVFWMTDPLKNEILYVSPAYETIWGRSCRSLYERPRSFLDSVHPEDLDRVVALSLERQVRGETADVEYRVVRPDGSVRWVRDRAFPVKDPSGRFYRVAGIAEDITDAKNAEQALRQSEGRLRTLSDNLPHGAIFQAVIDPAGRGRFTYFSAGAERMYGVAPDEIKADPNALYGLIHEDDRPRMMSEEAAALRDLTPFDCQFRSWTRSGAVIWVHCRSAPRRLPEGGTAWDGVVLDVTKARNAEQALRESEERFRRLIAANIVGVGISDGGGDWLEANDELLRIISCGREELRDGRLRWIDMTPVKYRSLEEERIAEARRRGACTPYEKEYVRKDGSLVPVLIGYAALEEGRDRFICFVLDLTLQKRVEAALKEADRHKDEFLAMLAHELRNPLAPVLNAVQVMKLLGSAEPNLQRAREMIERQVRRLARLVDDLLDVSRITRGKITLRKEAVELATVIARAVEISQPLMEARRHEWTVALPPEPVWLEGDAARLEQVVSNLLNNAAKYTEESGHIRLTVERGTGEAVLRVRDDGIGIPANLLPHVFDLFTQGDRSPARTEGGLGIGLTLVKSLVEMHGGSVEVRSEGMGKGSEFEVRLPVIAAQSPLPGGGGGTERDDRSPVPSRRVLVVDDNADAAEMLALFLRTEGHEVRTAHDGPAALHAAESFRPEVVLLDIGLPRMDGYTVVRRLREQPGLKTSLLVALTGYGQEEDRRAHEAGFDAHLVKPADSDELQKLLACIPVTEP